MENFITNNPLWFALIVALLIIWSLIWKGLALWKSARLGHKPWFIALLILNTVGILEILYVFVFNKMMEKGKCNCGHGKNKKGDCDCGDD